MRSSSGRFAVSDARAVRPYSVPMSCNTLAHVRCRKCIRPISSTKAPGGCVKTVGRGASPVIKPTPTRQPCQGLAAQAVTIVYDGFCSHRSPYLPLPARQNHSDSSKNHKNLRYNYIVNIKLLLINILHLQLFYQKTNH